MNLATKLVYLRKHKGLTQMALAESLNVSRQAISRWEVGAAVPSTDNLKILSELYGVSLDYLLSDDAEDSCNSVKDQEEGIPELPKKYKGVLLCGLILVVIIGICLVLLRNRSNEQFIPMEDMNTIEENEYTQVTFSFK